MKMVSWMWKGNSKDKRKQQEEDNQEELKKKGFDPLKIQNQQNKELKIQSFMKGQLQFIDPDDYEQALAIINQFKFFPNQEQHRHELGHKIGGKICGNKDQVNQIRSIGKYMIGAIGRKIISGDLNLLKVSFPVKANVPKTALYNSTMSCCTMPYFLKRACQSQSPLERMKYVITTVISCNYYMNLFLKPLNPVIGQTLQASYPDGTKIYCQQISHHPPISYFIIYGPDDSYRYIGYYNFQATAGLNSMTLTNKGRRRFEFKNGDIININWCKELFAGVFIGSLRNESISPLLFTDQKNDLKCQIKFGKVKKRPSDYFTSSIMHDGKAVSNIDGTYCGYLNFDDVRYWDGRYMQGFKMKLQENSLPSDFRNRQDLKLLQDGRLQQAQKAKQIVQQNQRRDAKLRQQNNKK